MELPRAEYPRPQFVRDDWMNLNGEWNFEIDKSVSGVERPLFNGEHFQQKINVPFCPESRLSGVGETDFLNQVWYQRTIEIPEHWLGNKICLHLNGVDYEAKVYIDGKSIGYQMSGHVGLSLFIENYVNKSRKINLVIRCKDDLRGQHQAGGKQSTALKSEGCFYTRVTGIWQTVWLEAFSEKSLKSCQIDTDIDSGMIYFSPEYFQSFSGKISAKIFDGEQLLGQEVISSRAPFFSIRLNSFELWSPENPKLYQVEYEIYDEYNQLSDVIKSYFGFRSIYCKEGKMYLNHKPYYQRLVLDQGFYPDGIWTAPSDEALKNDILLSKEVGFNGARLHQKIFEERFHYWADHLGYLTWAEYPSWGNKINSNGAKHFLREWQKVVKRDYNHPSIIAWTPLNEHNPIRHHEDVSHYRDYVKTIVALTKSLDRFRPVNDSSGWTHVETDIYTVHNYVDDPVELARQLRFEDGQSMYLHHPDTCEKYSGQPYIVDEFGGVKWIEGSNTNERTVSWGYGKLPQTKEEAIDRIKGQVNVLLENNHIAGYCYTQLTDVEQEENGVYTYDRAIKFDVSILNEIFGKNPKWWN